VNGQRRFRLDATAGVQIDIGDDSQDHLIKPEDRLTIAMARQ
jgi:hypothetical protein